MLNLYSNLFRVSIKVRVILKYNKRSNSREIWNEYRQWSWVVALDTLPVGAGPGRPIGAGYAPPRAATSALAAHRASPQLSVRLAPNLRMLVPRTTVNCATGVIAFFWIVEEFFCYLWVKFDGIVSLVLGMQFDDVWHACYQWRETWMLTGTWRTSTFRSSSWTIWKGWMWRGRRTTTRQKRSPGRWGCRRDFHRCRSQLRYSRPWPRRTPRSFQSATTTTELFTTSSSSWGRTWSTTSSTTRRTWSCTPRTAWWSAPSSRTVWWCTRTIRHRGPRRRLHRSASLRTSLRHLRHTTTWSSNTRTFSTATVSSRRDSWTTWCGYRSLSVRSRWTCDPSAARSRTLSGRRSTRCQRTAWSPAARGVWCPRSTCTTTTRRCACVRWVSVAAWGRRGCTTRWVESPTSSTTRCSPTCLCENSTSVSTGCPGRTWSGSSRSAGLWRTEVTRRTAAARGSYNGTNWRPPTDSYTRRSAACRWSWTESVMRETCTSTA